jgi:hypothetical protein
MELKPEEKTEHIEDIRPDWSFMRQLKMIDKRLGCKFNGDHFVITFQTEKYGVVNIWKVASETGGFRQPDRRELEIIRESDLERLGPKERWNLVLAHMEGTKERRNKSIRDEMRDRTKDGKIQLMRAFANMIGGAGKNNATFRRINVKPKSKGMITIP